MKYAKQTDPEITKLGRVLIIGAGIFSLIYVWVSMPYYAGYKEGFYGYGFSETGDVSKLFVARAITLTLYSLAGIGLYLLGMREKKNLTKWFGFWLTWFVVARLLLVEVWDMKLGARIVTFLIIGVIFIASVFIRRSNHEIP